MSGTIHVNTELMRELGSRFQENCEIARTKMISELQSMNAQIESDWIGLSRTHYDELFHQWVQSAQSLITWGDEIGAHLTKTAEYFDNVDQSS
jgi:WXG100 family type VII secretion target